VPYRGKINEPAYVVKVAETVARIKNVSIETVAEASRNLFSSVVLCRG
jgi:TatD DNase family protein